MDPLVSVVMPLRDRSPFLHRALAALRRQTLPQWELLLVARHQPEHAGDPRIRFINAPPEVGLGAALNAGLAAARADYLAYLPADDVCHRDHLATLLQCLEDFPHAAAAFSGVRHHYNRYALQTVPGEPLQLVQVLHRRAPARWLTDEECVTDDLDRMYWNALRDRGEFVGTGRVTCEWLDHPRQRHKLLRESEGGLNRYRQAWEVAAPIRIHTSKGNRLDEKALYSRFLPGPRPENGLKIVLAGELAYNPERVLALEQQGHALFGCWMRDPWWYNTVGPLPFGSVRDVAPPDLPALGADLIYAQLNWQAVPFVHHLLEANPRTPSVWHFKESPFICLERGTWPRLMGIYRMAGGHIFCSEEAASWTDTVLPPPERRKPRLILDGDLPKLDWFTGSWTPRLSDTTRERHTVVPGRPIGLHPEDVGELARHGVHLHFYGDFTQGEWRNWIAKAQGLAPLHLHLHSQVHADRWVEEFSRYDAGWLHYFQSENTGEITRANWDDLNVPARLTTLAAAGLPFLQRDNTGHSVAIQTIGRRHDCALFARSMRHVAEHLYDDDVLQRKRENARKHRSEFAFDTHVAPLVHFFKQVMDLQKL
ncbi:MAG: glycosyltransferase family A protein [Bryobacteraceae bacterium]|nr:glycosyltransferase family A protein [Bryobacteraceae bacterium]